MYWTYAQGPSFRRILSSAVLLVLIARHNMAEDSAYVKRAIELTDKFLKEVMKGESNV